MMRACGGFCAGVFLLALFVAGCMDERPSHRVGDIHALKGKTTAKVLEVLGEPRVVDTTASSREQIWGYYQMMIVDEHETSPRQRTVLIVFRKENGEFLVDEIKVP